MGSSANLMVSGAGVLLINAEWQNAATKQSESSATIHLAFNELEAVHVAFNLAIAPRGSESCVNRRMIAAEPGDERGQCGNFGVNRSKDPIG